MDAKQARWNLGFLLIKAPKPSAGPHKTRESIPLSLIVRNKLRLALNTRETKMVINAKEGNIAIDGKVRKNLKYPVGVMDVISLVKSGQNYRCLYDVKGRFCLQKIAPSEAEVYL